MIHLLVDAVYLHPGQTVGIGRGIDVETGEVVRFGGDWRPMQDLFEVITVEGPQDVQIESWQVLGGSDVEVEL